MNINFILNGEDVTVESEAGVRLINILREKFALFGAKSGCLTGQCGACAVLLNGRVSPACLIPAFRVKGCEVITIEGFSLTDEYQDIVSSFKQVHLGNCGYCEAGKILCTEALLERYPNPSKDEIIAGFSGVKCRCTNVERLVEAVGIAASNRQGRLYGRFS